VREGLLFAALIAAQALGFLVLGTGRSGRGPAESILVLDNLLALACTWIAFRRAHCITARFWFLFAAVLVVLLVPTAFQTYDTVFDQTTLSASSWRLRYCLYGAPILMMLFLPETRRHARVKSEIFLDYFQVAILIANGDTFGTLSLHEDDPLSPIPDHDHDSAAFARRRHLATAVAEHIALAVANLNLRESLRLQAVRDPLTGLYNRRYMQEFLDHGLHSARRKHRPLAVMMLDLDHFKRYNDNFGHSAGDRVLAAVGEILLRYVRAEDVACRYGGEEFALCIEYELNEGGPLPSFRIHSEESA
jgi:GGDEF domain-containing protein